MGLILLLMFIGLPIAEVYTFATVGDEIGGLATVGLCILTAVAGIAIARMQGMIALVRAQEAINKGVTPVAEVFTAVCLLIAGVLLAVPGFVTDTMGFLLLLPPVRMGFLAILGRQVRNGRFKMQGSFTSQAGPRPGPGPHYGAGGGAMDIEGEYREVDPDPHDPVPPDRRIDPS